MQLSLLRTQLRVLLGNPSTTDVPDAILNSYINRAIGEITDKFRFQAVRNHTTFPTVALTDTYTIPADGYIVLSVTVLADSLLERNLKLRRRDSDWFDRFADGQVQTRPTDYTRYQSIMRLWPVPDQVYTVQVYYKQIPAALVNDADLPVTPSTWDDGLLKKARFIFWDDRGEMAKAQYANSSFLQWLSDKPVEVDEEEFQDGNFEGVRVLGLRPDWHSIEYWRRRNFEIT